MANKRSNKNQSRRRKNQSQKNRMRGGSDFNVPIRAFYPQNTFAQDPSRQMSNSVMKGGSKKRKNHSRKYLKGGDGFFSNIGSLGIASRMVNQIAGTSPNMVMNYKV